MQGDKEMLESQNAHKGANFVFICIGQGGSNMGQAIKEILGIPNDKLIAVNMSQADLYSSKAGMKYKFGATEGAGKNRDLSKEEFKKDSGIFERIYNENKEKFYAPNTIIGVLFSTGGGTGSGVGPYFTTRLTQEVMKAEVSLINRPHVFGMAILPILNNQYDAGEKSYQNSLDCLNDVNKAVGAKAATFTLISNDLKNVANEINYKNVNEVYSLVNKRVANGIRRFFTELGVGDNNVDLQDRLTSLDIPGVFGIYSLEKSEEYQFLVPQQNDPARTLIAEIKKNEDSIENMRKWLNMNAISSVEEMISQTADNKVDITALFGITSVAKLVEIVKNKLEECIVRNSNKTNNVNKMAEGLVGIDQTRKAIESRNNKQIVSNIDDLI